MERTPMMGLREREEEGVGSRTDMRKIRQYRDDMSQEDSRVETAPDVRRVNSVVGQSDMPQARDIKHITHI